MENRGGGLWQVLRAATLLIAVLTLGALALDMRGSRVPATVVATIPAEPPTASPNAAPSATLAPATPIEDARPASVVPAEEWAAFLLEGVLPRIQGRAANLDGLAWWQGSDVSGVLSLDEEGLWLGERPIDPLQQNQVDIVIPDPLNPADLITVAQLNTEQGLLTLRTLSPAGLDNLAAARWVISGGTHEMAVRALAAQAQAREAELIVAYVAPGAGAAGQIALVSVVSDEPTPTPTATGPTPLPTFTPTGSPTPTPTREPDPYLQRLMAGVIDGVIAAAPSFTSNAVYEFAYGHPRTGLLTWSEKGAAVAGEVIAVEDATEMTFYMLVPDDMSGRTQRLFPVLYDGTVTRLPEEQVYFQGHRIDEMIYWMVRRAVEENGRLVVVYDDFGIKQAMTFIGFQPFAVVEPSPTPTNTPLPPTDPAAPR